MVLIEVNRMKKIIIFGNSGSGKSTLAKTYAIKFLLVHLDLDSLAWQNTNPPQRRKLDDSIKDINGFISKNESWVIEGCYADLLSSLAKQSTNMIFINPGTETCIANCKSRSWEPHKYKSKQAQDDNLCMLIDWIKQYTERTDEFSLTSHRELFDSFAGNKIEYTSNERN
jgi:adenylate kinase family enzyme